MKTKFNIGDMVSDGGRRFEINLIAISYKGTIYYGKGDGKYHPIHEDDLSLVPKTININGIEVPEPLRVAPEFGTVYFYPLISNTNIHNYSHWGDHSYDQRRLKHGFIHSTKEAAIAHAKALLSFTEVIA